MKCGLLLPHFGLSGGRDTLLTAATMAERYGFDSLWARDHIVFEPHSMEGPDRTHIDPFITLSMIAGATEHISLGTGSLIPYRHPIQTALALGSLDAVAGRRRVIAGFGIGSFNAEFAAVGLGGLHRGRLLEEQLEIIKALWSGEPVSHEGRYYRFDDVQIKPVPAAGTLPVWYCGNSELAVRRAVDHCEGWLPGRITLPTFESRVDTMHRYAREQGRQPVVTGAIPITSPGRSRSEALEKVSWQDILASSASSGWVRPQSGEWQSHADLDGALIAGTPSDIIAATQRFADAGAEHIVYDLRFRFDDLIDCIELLGNEVLPVVGDTVGSARVVHSRAKEQL
jgi:probable F420-dependent oxidoreductase